MPLWEGPGGILSVDESRPWGAGSGPCTPGETPLTPKTRVSSVDRCRGSTLPPVLVGCTTSSYLRTRLPSPWRMVVVLVVSRPVVRRARRGESLHPEQEWALPQAPTVPPTPPFDPGSGEDLPSATSHRRERPTLAPGRPHRVESQEHQSRQGRHPVAPREGEGHEVVVVPGVTVLVRLLVPRRHQLVGRPDTVPRPRRSERTLTSGEQGRSQGRRTLPSHVGCV